MLKKCILVLSLVILLTGCGIKSKDKNSKLTSKFEEQAVKYYNEKLKGMVEGVDEYTISIKNLEDSGYDLTGLEQCEKESTIKLVMTESNKTGYTIKTNLICEKEQ